MRASVTAGTIHPHVFNVRLINKKHLASCQARMSVLLVTNYSNGDASTSSVHLTGRERSCRNPLDKFLYMPRCLAVLVNGTDGLSRHDNLQHHGHNIANDLQLL